MVTLESFIRPVKQGDNHLIANLIHFEQHTHRHLDWRGPLEWVGSPHFWLAQQNGRTVAALACPPDPAQVYWLRLFTCAASVSLRETWRMLWETARLALRGEQGRVAIIALHDWMAALAEESGFSFEDDIIMMSWSGTLPQPPAAHITLRPMQVQDLPEVADVDAVVFPVLWQNSLPSLRLAYPQSGVAVVAEVDGQVAGYQMSTYGPFGAHLARLAVLPGFQRQGIGRALVSDLTRKVTARGLQRITVNTQSQNAQSQALYRAMGFAHHGESYPVYTWALNQLPS